MDTLPPRASRRRLKIAPEQFVSTKRHNFSGDGVFSTVLNDAYRRRYENVYQRRREKLGGDIKLKILA